MRAAPGAPAEVRSFQLTKSARQASLGVDAWDLDHLAVDGYGGGLGPVRLFEASGQPLLRMDAEHQSFVAEATH